MSRQLCFKSRKLPLSRNFAKRFCSMLRSLPEIQQAGECFQRGDLANTRQLLERSADIVQSVPDLHRIVNTALVDVNYEMGAFEKIIPLSDHLPVKKALATAALSKYESISEFELDYLFLALSGKAAMDIVKLAEHEFGHVLSPKFGFKFEDLMSMFGNVEETYADTPELLCVYLREMAKSLARNDMLKEAAECCSKASETAKLIECETTAALESCESSVAQAEIQFAGRNVMVAEGLFRHCEDELEKPLQVNEKNPKWLIARTRKKLLLQYSAYLETASWNDKPRTAESNDKVRKASQICDEFPFLLEEKAEVIPAFLFRELYSRSLRTNELLFSSS